VSLAQLLQPESYYTGGQNLKLAIDFPIYGSAGGEYGLRLFTIAIFCLLLVAQSLNPTESN